MQITWREMLQYKMTKNGETWNDVESYLIWVERLRYIHDDGVIILGVDVLTLSKEELLDVVFDNGYGLACPIQIKVWTPDFVYFSDEYDGSDFIHCVERNPIKEAENTELITYFLS